MEIRDLGRLILIAGLGMVLIGGILLGWGDKFSWLGHLPGDIRLEKEHFRLYIPITTMLLISVVLTLILRVWHGWR